MERLTIRSEKGFVYRKNCEISDRDAWSKLADYEDAGIPPEEIEQLMKTCHTAVELWTNTASKFCKMNDEIEHWKAESISDKSKLGILRYYFEKNGTTLEQVLEDCKTMFPEGK